MIAAHPAGLEAAAARRRTRQWHVGPQERRVPALLAAIVISTVAGLYEVQDSSITGSRRHPYLVEARRIACQLLYERGYGESAIGRVIGRDHSTVTHALRRLETRMSPQEWYCLQTCRRIVRARLAQQQGA